MKDNPILSDRTETQFFQETILPPLLASENLTIMWVRHGGRRKSMVYLSKNADRFNFQKLGKYKVCYIDKDEIAEDHPTAYFHLMIKALHPKVPTKAQATEENLDLLRKTITEMIEKGFHLVFILGRFDEISFPTYFFNNLHSLWHIDKTKVNYIFPINSDIFRPETFNQYGQLREELTQNLIYFPLLNEEDRKIISLHFSAKYGYKLTPKATDFVKNISGGHTSLHRAMMKVLWKNPDLSLNQSTIEFLFNHLEIKIILDDLWQSLNNENQEIIIKIAHQTPLETNKIGELLKNLKIVVFDMDRPVLFSPLLEIYAQRKEIGKRILTLDTQNGEILVDGQPIKEKITLQEYHLLSTFLEKSGVVLSRDTIAEILWGKDSFNKYSDWAIDQLISQLRRKLECLEIPPNNLQTIRGRGYRWIE